MSATLTTEPSRANTEPAVRTVADLVHALGNIGLSRIRVLPGIGMATENDLLSGESKYCELVDQTLVEKSMGFFEGRVGTVLLVYIEMWLAQNNIGFANGEGAATRFAPGLVRIPDVSFFRWERFPARKVPQDPICSVAPNLAVEILSEGNTPAEMDRKRHEYFAAGVELVWIVDPRKQTIEVWSTDRDCHILGIEDTLSGGSVLPGFELRIKDWFDRAGAELK